jgi:hypothetical protein
LLFESDMIERRGMTCAALALGVALLAGCTGGTEGSAAEEKAPQKNPIVTSSAPAEPQAQPQPDPRQELKAINRAIPVYAGAKFRGDLTHRDAVMVRNQYGPQAEVYTLATDDSFPQVYHYYTTYLAQFRAYPAKAPYPPDQDWRTLEVQLNQAMQDPFIPGDTLKAGDKQVTLQVVETEAEPKTVIRYILTPPSSAPAAPVVAAGQ